MGKEHAQWQPGKLHEFQARLLASMDASRDGSGLRDSRLGVMVGDRCCLIDLREAAEIVPVTAMTDVPLTKDWYVGLANIRGNLVGVVDLQRFYGGPMRAPSKDSRVIVLAAALSATTGLLVERVLGLRYIGDMTLLEESATGSTTDKDPRYQDSAGTQWRALRLATLLEDPRFLYVGV